MLEGEIQKLYEEHFTKEVSGAYETTEDIERADKEHLLEEELDLLQMKYELEVEDKIWDLRILDSERSLEKFERAFKQGVLAGIKLMQEKSNKN